MSWIQRNFGAVYVLSAGGLAIALGMLGACASEKAAPLPAAPAPTCLGVKTWSPDEERALASWLSAQPAGSIQVAAWADYSRMRKAARAACPGR